MLARKMLRPLRLATGRRSHPQTNQPQTKREKRRERLPELTNFGAKTGIVGHLKICVLGYLG